MKNLSTKLFAGLLAFIIGVIVFIAFSISYNNTKLKGICLLRLPMAPKEIDAEILS